MAKLDRASRQWVKVRLTNFTATIAKQAWLDDGQDVHREYEIEAKDSDEFLATLEEFSRVRRRDGASRWGVYYDTEHPTRYLETFTVESWAEHLRQHTRLTQADREVEERLRRFEAKPTTVRHFIYARSKGPT